MTLLIDPLNRDELRTILDPADVTGPDYPSKSFRVLKTNEIRQFGEVRTQRLGAGGVGSAVWGWVTPCWRSPTSPTPIDRQK